MIYGVSFRAEHLFQMRFQPAQEQFRSRLVEQRDLQMLENEWGGTLMQDGRPLVCAIVIPMWADRVLLSTFLSDRVSPKNFIGLHRQAKQFLNSLPFKRIEAAVDVDFCQGHRWVAMLGFQKEADRMKCFLDNRDWALYALVR